MVHIRVWERG